MFRVCYDVSLPVVVPLPALLSHLPVRAQTSSKSRYKPHTTKQPPRQAGKKHPEIRKDGIPNSHH